uniref:Membrane protein BRI3 n=1 Tax=Capra hircus TaxID=9925 RepID=A0A8C2PNW9_CAPHI
AGGPGANFGRSSTATFNPETNFSPDVAAAVGGAVEGRPRGPASAGGRGRRRPGNRRSGPRIWAPPERPEPICGVARAQFALPRKHVHLSAGIPTHHPRVYNIHSRNVTRYPANSIVVVGGCPVCRVGVLEDSFTFLGIFLAIVLFPFGFICCFALRKRRCPNCGANFT